MDVMDALLTRRSCRKYTDEPVDVEDLDAVLKAGTYAPTGMNRQAPVIIAVTNRQLRDELSAANAKVMGKDIDPFYGAPAVLAVVADKSAPTHVYDGACVMENLMLAATARGLGSCWIHRAKEVFESDFGRDLLAQLGLVGEYEGVGFCILGHAAVPAATPAPRKENYVIKVD